MIARTTRHEFPRARRRAAGLGALALSAAALSTGSMLWQPGTALADTSTPSGCVSAGQVWVQVTTDTGRTLANRCVGTPATGTAALQAAGLGLGRDSSGMLCSIGGYPATCRPWSQTHQYWNYYHLTPGGSWQYSTLGADQYAPKPGTVEGWCYNAPTAKSCTPPKVNATIIKTAPAPTARATATTTKPAATHTASAPSTPLDEVTPPPSSALATATARARTTPAAPTTTPPATVAATSATPSAIVTATPTPSVTPSLTPSPVASSASPTPTEVASADPTPAATTSSTSSSGSGPWGIIATIGLLAAGGLGYWLWRRRTTAPRRGA